MEVYINIAGRLVLFVGLLLLLGGCAAPSPRSGATGVETASATFTNAQARPTTLQQLRVSNSSTTDLVGLKVLFPGPTSTSKATGIEFGAVAAGGTSVYRNVPGGVYRYAAYEYPLNGRVVHQAVTDWVGESPMQGEKFTYRVALDLTRPEGNQVQLIEVSVDQP